MKPIKCISCGANIGASIKNHECVCPYCGTAYEEEKKPKPDVVEPTVEEPKIDKVEAEEKPRFINEDKRSFLTTRPKLHVGLAILGLIFYVWPGILYMIIVRALQDKWDREHDN